MEKLTVCTALVCLSQNYGSEYKVNVMLQRISL